MKRRIIIIFLAITSCHETRQKSEIPMNLIHSDSIPRIDPPKDVINGW